MDPMQCWPLRILYADYNRAVRALKSVGVDRFTELKDQLSSFYKFVRQVLRSLVHSARITDNDITGLFEAGTGIQKWRTGIANSMPEDKVSY
jgi:hypothetical protein